MVGKAKPATAAEKRRNTRVASLGCVCCMLKRRPSPAQVHHLVEGAKRNGQDETIPLCDYHHMGYSYCRFAGYQGWPYAKVRAELGPSLATEKKQFIEEFGDEQFLLELTNNLIEDDRNLQFAQEVQGA